MEQHAAEEIQNGEMPYWIFLENRDCAVNAKKMGSRRGEVREEKSPCSGHFIGDWNRWLLWRGVSPIAYQPRSNIGIYTDFT